MFLTPWIRTVQNRLSWSRWLRKNRRHQKLSSSAVRRMNKQAELLEARTLLTSPNFVSVGPNVGTFLQDGDVRTDIPQELLFQVTPGQTLDTSTLGAVTVTAAGNDNSFSPASAVTDFGTNGLAVVEIGTQRLGADENGTVLTIQSANTGVGPTITGSPFTNEIQEISLDSSFSGGTFTLGFGASVTGPLAFNASAGAIQTALNGLASINGTGSVIVRGGPLASEPVSVEFTGGFTDTDVTDLVIDSSNLQNNEFQTFTVTGDPTGGTFQVAFDDAGLGITGNSLDINFDDDATAVEAAIVGGIPALSGRIQVTGGVLPDLPVSIEFIGTAGDQDVAQFTINVSSLTGGTAPSVDIATTNAGNLDAVFATLATGTTGFLTLTLDTGTPTTVQDLVNFSTTDATARQLLRVTLLEGDAAQVISAAPTQALTMTGAGAASALSSFDTGTNLQLRFTAATAGLAGNDISIQFNRLDLGAVSAVPQISVVGSRIRVTLNENASALTTAQDLVDALNVDSAASALIGSSVAIGLGATDVTTVTDGTLLRLSGADRVVAPGYRDLTSNSNEVIFRFAEQVADDLYFIQVLGTGHARLTNTAGEALNSLRDSFQSFSLDLGGEVRSVVPQPVLREQTLTINDVADLADGDTITVDPGVGIYAGATSSLDSLGAGAGEVTLVFESAQQGTSGNNISVSLDTAALGSSGSPTVNVSGRSVSILLNSDAGSETTAQQLVDAISSNVDARSLIAVLIQGDADFTVGASLGGPATLNLTGGADLFTFEINDTAGGPAGVRAGNIAVDVDLTMATPGQVATAIAVAIDGATLSTPDVSADAAGTNVVTVVGGAFDVVLSTTLADAASITQGTGGLVQRENLVNVFFNGDDLDENDATNPRFYQLVDTAGTADTTDDIVRIPSSVIYDRDNNTAVLDFGSGLATDVLATFADADPDTISRTVGSWLDDGFSAGQTITVSGSTSNDGLFTIDSVTPTTITLLASDTLSDDGPEIVTVAGVFNLPSATYRLQVGTSDEGGDDTASALKLGTIFAGSGFNTNAVLGDSAAGTGDADLYEFSVDSAGSLTVTSTPGNGLDSFLELLQSDGVTPVGGTAFTDNAADTEEMLTAAGLAMGTYFVRVTSSGGASRGSYVLDIVTTAPDQTTDNNNSAYATASDIGTLGVAGVTLSSSISNIGGLLLPPLPGDGAPGHRDIPVAGENHGGGGGATPGAPGATSVRFYNFREDIGSLFGVPQTNQITEGQKELTRYIFEIYSRYLGIQFIETADQGTMIATADVRITDPTLPPSVAGISSVIIGAAGGVASDEAYGGGWMGIAFHEIAHTLGLGHTGDLRAHQNGGGGGAGPTAESATTDYDLDHLAAVHPPFSVDIDLYKFTLEEIGTVSAEITAERQAAASNLDSVLTLFRDPFAKTSTDFAGSGATVDFVATSAGTFGNDIQITFQKSDLGTGTAPIVSVSGHSITVTLNTDAAAGVPAPTTADQLITAIQGNFFSNLLVTATLSSSVGSGANDITTTTSAGSVIGLNGGNREVIARNDDYYSNDSFLSQELEPGVYYLGVSAKGNDSYDPSVSDSGYGGQSDGAYNLDINFTPSAAASTLADADGTATPFDGNADGITGDAFDFWFESGSTVFVDKATPTPLGQQDGTLAQPYSTIAAGVQRAASRIVVPSTGAAALRDNLFDTGTAAGVVGGDYFTISDGSNPERVFEFDLDGLGVIGSNVAIDLSSLGDPTDPVQVANAIRDAINGQTSGTFLISAIASGDHVDLTGAASLDVSTTPGLLTAQSLLRIIGNGGTDRDPLTPADAIPYLIGINNVNATLADGRGFNVPQGVTAMIDAGAVIKLQSANIDVGSTSSAVDRQDAALQVLGTPDSKVYLTTFRNDALGGNSDGASAGPVPGQWGGIVFPQRFRYERHGRR